MLRTITFVRQISTTRARARNPFTGTGPIYDAATIIGQPAAMTPLMDPGAFDMVVPPTAQEFLAESLGLAHLSEVPMYVEDIANLPPTTSIGVLHGPHAQPYFALGVAVRGSADRARYVHFLWNPVSPWTYLCQKVCPPRAQKRRMC